MLSRFAKCKEIGDLAAFLVSDAASFVSSPSIVAGGGQTIDGAWARAAFAVPQSAASREGYDWRPVICARHLAVAAASSAPEGVSTTP